MGRTIQYFFTASCSCWPLSLHEAESDAATARVSLRVRVRVGFSFTSAPIVVWRARLCLSGGVCFRFRNRRGENETGKDRENNRELHWEWWRLMIIRSDIPHIYRTVCELF